MQLRSAILARMGAIVFSYDMVAGGTRRRRLMIIRASWPCSSGTASARSNYLESLGGVDMKRIGITGASGGGTQTFLLTAVMSGERVGTRR